MKYPKKNGQRHSIEDEELVNPSVVHRCSIVGCEKECPSQSSLQRHSIVSHGLVPQSSTRRQSFSLFSTPLSRVIRPLCSLRRTTTFRLEMKDLRRQWTNDKDIRRALASLREQYRTNNEQRRREKHFEELYPFQGENSFSFLPSNVDEEQIDLRYPRETNKDFYAEFVPSNRSILKERPFETLEHSNEGELNQQREKRIQHLHLPRLESSPKRTLIDRQNLLKTKSVRPRPSTVPFVDRETDDDGVLLILSSFV